MTNRRPAAPRAQANEPITPANGETLIAHLADETTAAETMKTLRRAARGGWKIPEKALKRAPRMVAKHALGSTDPMLIIEATKTLAILRRDNINALEASHRIERLEAGESTENHAHAVVTPEQLRAIAKTIDPDE